MQVCCSVYAKESSLEWCFLCKTGIEFLFCIKLVRQSQEASGKPTQKSVNVSQQIFWIFILNVLNYAGFPVFGYAYAVTGSPPDFTPCTSTNGEPPKHKTARKTPFFG